jgi:single-strand DNA-binding protein
VAGSCACGHPPERHIERNGERCFCAACSCLHFRRPKGANTLASADVAPTATAKVGTLTADPELRVSANGTSYLRARLAVSSPGRETVFYDIVAFGGLAEHAGASLHKGDRVVVVGIGKRKTWTGRDGREWTTKEIVADGLGPDLRFTSVTLEQTQDQARPGDHRDLDRVLKASP